MAAICPIKFRILSPDDFRRLDYQVMSHVFASQNELGRLHDECIYQNDLAARLTASGLGPVQTEVPLTVSWRNFRKNYFLDLVIQDTLLHELKTASAIIGEHKTQLLNYVLLLNLHSAKLINFRPPQIESWFASTTLTLEDRTRICADQSRWQEVAPRDAEFQAATMELVRELGAYLDIALYEDLLTQFLGGEAQVLQPIEVCRNEMLLGRQHSRLIAPDVAFRITAHTDERDQVEPHLRRWLAHTRLRALQWINLNRTQIEFITLLN
jgi:GxxExxY protein